jgi:SAM-dependent methyltransferase
VEQSDSYEGKADAEPTIGAYYDRLASYYKFLFQDWEASVQRQASVLDSVIREYFGADVHGILDAACGIGTQCIGLAQLGYAVTASDISPVEIEWARAEAEIRGLQIPFEVGDMRQLAGLFSDSFDVVIACDNAIPHLLSEAEILQAFEQFYQCTTPQGGCIISVRDYACMERSGSRFYPRTIHTTADGRVVVFDVWEFEGDFYDFTTYIIEDKNQPAAAVEIIRGGRYYCITTAALERLMRQAGFQQVVTLTDRFYQPLIVGVKGQAMGGAVEDHDSSPGAFHPLT